MANLGGLRSTVWVQVHSGEGGSLTGAGAVLRQSDGEQGAQRVKRCRGVTVTQARDSEPAKGRENRQPWAAQGGW